MSRPSLCLVPSLLPSPSTAPCPAPTDFTNTFDSYLTEIIKVNGPASQILIFTSPYHPLCLTSWSCPICDRERWRSPQGTNLSSFLTCSQPGAQLLTFSTRDILGQLTPLWGLFCAFSILTNVHPLEAKQPLPHLPPHWDNQKYPQTWPVSPGTQVLPSENHHFRGKEQSYHFFTFGPWCSFYTDFICITFPE